MKILKPILFVLLGIAIGVAFVLFFQACHKEKVDPLLGAWKPIGVEMMDKTEGSIGMWFYTDGTMCYYVNKCDADAWKKCGIKYERSETLLTLFDEKAIAFYYSFEQNNTILVLHYGGSRESQKFERDPLFK